MASGRRAALVIAVLVLAAGVPAQDVPALAAELFAARGVRGVLVATASATLRVYRGLAEDGRFQVSGAAGSPPVADVPDTRGRSSVGVVMDASEPPAWFDPGDRAWFNASYVWLVVDGAPRRQCGGNAPPRPAAWALRLDSEVFLAVPDGDGRAWRVDEVFRVNAQDAAVRWPFASWSPTAGLVAAAGALSLGPGGDLLAERRTQLRRAAAGPRPLRVEAAVFCEGKTGTELLARLLELPPDEATKHASQLSILSFTIMDNTFGRYNMSVRLHEHLSSGELVLPPSGYFSGANGNVQRGAQDLAMTGMILSDSRLQVFKYTATTCLVRNTCLFLADGSLGTVDALLTPFTLRAWLGVVGIALVAVVLHKCFRQVEGDRINWSEGLLSSVGTFTGQGFGSPGQWFSGYGLLVIFDFLFLLLDGFHNSAIVKSLLRPPPPSVHNVYDLLDSNYHVALTNWWLAVRNFQNASPGLELTLYEKKIQPPAGLGFLPPVGLYRVLLKPLHAIIGPEESVYKSTEMLTEGQACRLHELEITPPQHIAPLIGRHCAFAELLYAGWVAEAEVVAEAVEGRDGGRGGDRGGGRGGGRGLGAILGSHARGVVLL